MMNYGTDMIKALTDTLNGLMVCASNPKETVEIIISHTLFSGAPVCKVREKYQASNTVDSICYSTDNLIGSCPLQTKDGTCGGGCLDSELYRLAVSLVKMPTESKNKRLRALLFRKYNAVLNTVKKSIKKNGWKVTIMKGI